MIRGLLSHWSEFSKLGLLLVAQQMTVASMWKPNWVNMHEKKSHPIPDVKIEKYYWYDQLKIFWIWTELKDTS